MLRQFFRKVGIFTLFATLLLIAAPTHTASADEGHDEQLRGNFVVADQTANCTSPVGLCLAGTLHGDLTGHITGQVTSIDTITKDKQTHYLMKGYFDITTDRGTLHGDASFLDTVQNTGHGTLTITAGTGAYNGVRGLFDLDQPVPPDANGNFTFYYHGTLHLYDRHN